MRRRTRICAVRPGDRDFDTHRLGRDPALPVGDGSSGRCHSACSPWLGGRGRTSPPICMPLPTSRQGGLPHRTAIMSRCRLSVSQRLDHHGPHLSCLASAHGRQPPVIRVPLADRRRRGAQTDAPASLGGRPHLPGCFSARGLRLTAGRSGSDHDHDRGCQLAMQTCLCTVAGSSSSVSMQVARSAREMLKQCGRLRSIAVR